MVFLSTIKKSISRFINLGWSWDGLVHPSLTVSKCKLPLMTGQGKNCLKVLRHLRKFPTFHSQVCQQQPQQYFVDAP